MKNRPKNFNAINAATTAAGFTMPSEELTGATLAMLAASKPGGWFLELGTGTGLSAAWLLHGMDADARLQSVDNDETVVEIARGGQEVATLEGQKGAILGGKKEPP